MSGPRGQDKYRRWASPDGPVRAARITFERSSVDAIQRALMAAYGFLKFQASHEEANTPEMRAQILEKVDAALSPLASTVTAADLQGNRLGDVDPSDATSASLITRKVAALKKQVEQDLTAEEVEVSELCDYHAGAVADCEDCVGVIDVEAEEDSVVELIEGSTATTDVLTEEDFEELSTIVDEANKLEDE